MKSDDVDTRWMVREKKEQATGFNTFLPSLDYKMLIHFFFNIDIQLYLHW